MDTKLREAVKTSVKMTSDKDGIEMGAREIVNEGKTGASIIGAGDLGLPCGVCFHWQRR